MAGRSGACHHGPEAPIRTWRRAPTATQVPQRPASSPAIVRSRDNRVLLGVAGGLGERLGVDPVLIRVAFAVLAIAGGSGVVLYLLAWAVSVEPDSDTARARPVRRPSARQAFALGLVVLGTMLLLREVGLWFGDQIVWPIALAAAGSAVIWARSDDRDRARWARIPGNPIEAMFTGRVGLIRIVVGGLLVASGLGLGFANTGADLAAAGNALLGVAISLIGLGLIFGPWATRLVHQLAEERRGRIRSEERAEMAAHLHDSVLQTLALIQRRPTPRPRSSAWPAARSGSCGPGCTGRRCAPEGRLAAGRRGDRRPRSSSATTCPSTSWWSATPRSTRPAGPWSTPAGGGLVNAARHSGAPLVSVYVEVEPDERHRCSSATRARASTPTSVPTDRRGIADSIARPDPAPRRRRSPSSPAPARAPRSSCAVPRSQG